MRLLVEDALDDGGGGLGGAGAEVPGAGVQGGVAEEGLDLGGVGAALAEAGGEGVAEPVGPGLPKPRSGARWSITASHRLAIPGSREYECLSLVPQSSAVTSTNATLCTSPQLQEN